MDQSNEPKKYPPTEKKLADLRKRGQFPKTELAVPNFEVIFFGLIFISFLYVLFNYTGVVLEALVFYSASQIISWVIDVIFLAIGVIALLKTVLLLIQWVMLNHAVINTEGLKPDINKLNPVNGFKNVFGLEGLSKSFSKVLELCFLLFLIYYIFSIKGVEINLLWQLNNTTSVVKHLIMAVGGVAVFFLIYGVIIATIDFMIELYHFIKKNRMTFTELKNELKETEGSPEMKSHRKMRMREIMEEAPSFQNRKPTFALANPTHILVPISYIPGVDRVPLILQVSLDAKAQYEKQQLIDAGIPVIENKLLARALYKKSPDGLCVLPKEFFKQIALILKALEKMNARKDLEKVISERRADFVLTNGSNLLIPISYDKGHDKVPLILQICVDDEAGSEKQKLLDAKVRLVENNALAEAIYQKNPDGRSALPEEFFEDIAKILLRI